MSTHTRMTTWWHGLFFAINLNIFLLFIYFSVSTTTEEIRMDHFTLSLSIYHFFFCDFPAFRYWTCSKNPIKKKKMYKNGTIIITIKKKRSVCNHCCVCCSSTGNVLLERSMLVHSWRGNTHKSLCTVWHISYFFLSPFIRFSLSSPTMMLQSKNGKRLYSL